MGEFMRETLEQHSNIAFRSFELDYILELRDKLWRKDKIRREGFTYSEWKKKQKGDIK